MTVLIYVDTSKQVGNPDHLKVFANADAAEAWFAENDPEGVAFEYEVIGRQRETGGPSSSALGTGSGLGTLLLAPVIVAPLTWRIGLTAPVIERAGAVSNSEAAGSPPG